MNLYSTPAKVKDRLDIADTIDDVAILAALETVSREIDRYCGRRFYVELATRYYAACGSYLRVDDLLSVTSIKTDSNLDRSYATTLATTDYELDPPNAPSESPPEPYTRICRTPLSQQGFRSGDPRGNQITGKWGYYEVLETVAATVVEALDASETSIDVSNAALFEAGQTILVDDEQMYVSAATVNTAPTEDTLTVIRGVNGTTAAAHLTATAIRRYTYPVIGEACTQQAILAFKGYSAPTGDIGTSGEFSQQIVSGGLHPFVKRMLETFRRMEQG